MAKAAGSIVTRLEKLEAQNPTATGRVYLVGGGSSESDVHGFVRANGHPCDDADMVIQLVPLVGDDGWPIVDIPLAIGPVSWPA
jgi:hypothetical protein